MSVRWSLWDSTAVSFRWTGAVVDTLWRPQGSVFASIDKFNCCLYDDYLCLPRILIDIESARSTAAYDDTYVFSLRLQTRKYFFKWVERRVVSAKRCYAFIQLLFSWVQNRCWLLFKRCCLNSWFRARPVTLWSSHWNTCHSFVNERSVRRQLVVGMEKIAWNQWLWVHIDRRVKLEILSKFLVVSGSFGKWAIVFEIELQIQLQ